MNTNFSISFLLNIQLMHIHTPHYTVLYFISILFLRIKIKNRYEKNIYSLSILKVFINIFEYVSYFFDYQGYILF